MGWSKWDPKRLLSKAFWWVFWHSLKLIQLSLASSFNNEILHVIHLWMRKANVSDVLPILRIRICFRHSDPQLPWRSRQCGADTHKIPFSLSALQFHNFFLPTTRKGDVLQDANVQREIPQKKSLRIPNRLPYKKHFLPLSSCGICFITISEKQQQICTLYPVHCELTESWTAFIMMLIFGKELSAGDSGWISASRITRGGTWCEWPPYLMCYWSQPLPRSISTRSLGE